MSFSAEHIPDCQSQEMNHRLILEAEKQQHVEQDSNEHLRKYHNAELFRQKALAEKVEKQKHLQGLATPPAIASLSELEEHECEVEKRHQAHLNERVETAQRLEGCHHAPTGANQQAVAREEIDEHLNEATQRREGHLADIVEKARELEVGTYIHNQT